jgi:hypothetical protein
VFGEKLTFASLLFRGVHVLHSPLLPPSFRECRHRSLACRCVAVRRRAFLVVAKDQRPHPRHSHRREAVELKIRPTTMPLVSTSKSSSFHSPDVIVPSIIQISKRGAPDTRFRKYS